MYNVIKDPVTGQLFKTNSKRGQEIISKYVQYAKNMANDRVENGRYICHHSGKVIATAVRDPLGNLCDRQQVLIMLYYDILDSPDGVTSEADLIPDVDIQKEIDRYNSTPKNIAVEPATASLVSPKSIIEPTPKPSKKITIIPKEEFYDKIRDLSHNKFSKLGSGSFKVAYKLDKNTVITKENLTHKSKKFEKYKNELNKLHSLPEKIKKNLLIPEKLGESGRIRIMTMPLCKTGDAFDYVQGDDIINIDKKNLHKNLAELLETVKALHDKNISCLDIKLENTFTTCGGTKNLFTLGDTDGFTVFDNKDQMWENEICVSSPGYYVPSSLAKKDGVKLGGPNTDWFAILMVVLFIYYRHKVKDKNKFYDIMGRINSNFDKSDRIKSINKLYNDDYRRINFKRNISILNNSKKTNDKIIDLITNALVSCGMEELYNRGKIEIYWYFITGDGPNNWYKIYIKPIIEELLVDNGTKQSELNPIALKKKLFKIKKLMSMTYKDEENKKIMNDYKKKN